MSNNPCNCNREWVEWTDDVRQNITDSLCKTYSDKKGVNHIGEHNLPQYSEIIKALSDLMEILFPGYFGHYQFDKENLKEQMSDLVDTCQKTLSKQIERALQYYCKINQCCHEHCPERASDVVIKLLCALPQIRETLKVDIDAFMSGDPAAKTRDEIVLSYPGLKAIAIYRIANVLYKHNVPVIPRVMTEHAHHETGIDIHPGATISEGLFIDHGTGVVIGETAIIGKNVKIYQGVTLGAISFPKDDEGHAIKGQKRHPNIENNVTIYAGATILGDITIGEKSTIGGNVWLTESIPANTQVTIPKPDLKIKTR